MDIRIQKAYSRKYTWSLVGLWGSITEVNMLKVKEKEQIGNDEFYLILENDEKILVTKEEFYVNREGEELRLEIDLESYGLGYK